MSPLIQIPKLDICPTGIWPNKVYNCEHLYSMCGRSPKGDDHVVILDSKPLLSIYFALIQKPELHHYNFTNVCEVVEYFHFASSADGLSLADEYSKGPLAPLYTQLAQMLRDAIMTLYGNFSFTASFILVVLNNHLAIYLIEDVVYA